MNFPSTALKLLFQESRLGHYPELLCNRKLKLWYPTPWPPVLSCPFCSPYDDPCSSNAHILDISTVSWPLASAYVAWVFYMNTSTLFSQAHSISLYFYPFLTASWAIPLSALIFPAPGKRNMVGETSPSFVPQIHCQNLHWAFAQLDHSFTIFPWVTHLKFDPFLKSPVQSMPTTLLLGNNLASSRVKLEKPS
jgi:hypothetical protein